MDKTIELVIAASVLMMVALVLMFMVTNQSDDAEETFTDITDSSKCSLWESQYKSGGCTSSNLKSKYDDSCSGSLPSSC